MSDRVVVLVQARVGSSRLPGKSLKPMHGRPMVSHVLRRARALGYDTVVATSVSERDDLLADTVRDLGVPVYRGSEWDVLSRMAGAAQMMEADVVVRVTADCPLWAPDVGQQVLSVFLAGPRDGVVSNDTTTSGWPDGLDVEVFTCDLLLAATAAAEDRNCMSGRSDREHVTPWMRRTAPHRIVVNDEDWRRFKLSVDTAEDFERVRGVMALAADGDLTWTATRGAAREYLRRLKEDIWV